MSYPQSSLGRHVAPSPKTPAEIRAEAAKAYHQTGLVLINPEWLASWADRKTLELMADKLFGRRNPK